MVMFVVKILAAGYRGAMESDVLASIFSTHFGEFQRILKYFEISLNISAVEECLCCKQISKGETK